MTTGAHELAKLLRLQFGLHELVPLLYRLLAAGRPVTVEQAAAAGGWTPGQVRAELDRHPGVDWDDEGRVIGFGLTLRPTPHRFAFTESTDADGADGGGDRVLCQ